MRYLLVLFLVACASPGMKTEELMQAWVGHDLNEIVGSWGPPTFDMELMDGEKVYTWRHTGSYTAPNRTTRTGAPYSAGSSAYDRGNSTTGAGNSFIYWCDKSFTVNAEGTITTGSLRGNACN